MTNQITDTKLLENQILGNQIAGTPQYHSGNLLWTQKDLHTKYPMIFFSDQTLVENAT